MDQELSAQAAPSRPRVGLLVALLLALALPLAPGAGQLPAGSEVPGFDFPPGGVWRGRTELILQQRQSLIGQGALWELNGTASPRVAGTLRLAVVPVLFKGGTPPWPVSRYQERLFAAEPQQSWSMTSYYRVQSRGAFQVVGKVFDWVTLPQPEEYYTDGCNGIGTRNPCPVRERPRMLEFLTDALDQISASGDLDVWRGFDNDGPDGIPDSGDDDGVVDLVVFLQPSVDGACGTNGLWAHRYGISSWGLAGGYQTRTPRAGHPGQRLRIDSYTLQSGVGGNTACESNQLMTVGAVTHETGHALGLPDLYDTDDNSGTSGIGDWGLMGTGTYSRPYSPVSFTAWSLIQLGWVKVDTLVSGREVTTGPVQVSDTVFLGRTSLPGWWLLLENRQARANDTAGFNPGFSHARAPGLLIWQVDADRIAAGRPLNQINTGLRQGLSLIQADGLDQLRSRGASNNRGDSGDAWPGATGAADFGLATKPAAMTWEGTPLDTRIDRITQYPDGRISFRYLQRTPTLIAATDVAAVIRFGPHRANRISEVLAPGEQVTISADSLQATLDGRSALAFSSWSDGGPRERTLIAADGPPDSLWAAFSTMHRIRVTLDGNGDVGSTVGTVTGGGIFLPVGTTLSLKAVAGPGAEFLGWWGDTTARSSKLTLRLEGAADLTARFRAAINPDPAALLRSIMLNSTVDSNVVSYLDAIGNRNGILDIGDFLAWMARRAEGLPTLDIGVPS